MIRYINASDVSKVLGKKYGNVWVKKNEVLDIIHNRRKVFNNKPPTFDLNEKTIQAIQESNMDSKIIPELNKLKKEIIHKDNFEDYSLSKEELLNNLPNKRLKRAIDEDLTMDRGNVEEERIIIEQSIKKDNVLHFYNFKV